MKACCLLFLNFRDDADLGKQIGAEEIWSPGRLKVQLVRKFGGEDNDNNGDVGEAQRGSDFSLNFKMNKEIL